MKHLDIQTPLYQSTLEGFERWLATLGYCTEAVKGLPVHIQEMLYYFEQQGITELQAISPMDIHYYYEELCERPNERRRSTALGANAINKHIQAIQLFLKYARQNAQLVMPHIHLQREEADTKPISILTVAEAKRLFLAADQQEDLRYAHIHAISDKALLTVFYSCGLRKNEVYHMNKEDILLEKRLIHVRKGKNHKERFVPFGNKSLEYLMDYLQNARPKWERGANNPALFLSYRGQRMSKESMYVRVKLLIKKAGINKNITPHGLRHSIATHLLQSGMDIKRIRTMLGHKSLDSTQIYTHFTTT